MVQSAANAEDRGVRHRNVSLNKHNSTKGSLGQDCPRICFPQNPRSGDRKFSLEIFLSLYAADHSCRTFQSTHLQNP